MPEHRLQGQPAIAMALVPAADGKPAEPPTGRIRRRGMNDVETRECTPRFDRDDRMRRAAQDGRDNVADRPEETVHLVRVEVDGGDQVEFGSP